VVERWVQGMHLLRSQCCSVVDLDGFMMMNFHNPLEGIIQIMKNSRKKNRI